MSNEPITRGEFTAGMDSIRQAIEAVGAAVMRQDGKIDALAVQLGDRNREMGELSSRVDGVENKLKQVEDSCKERHNSVSKRQDSLSGWLTGIVGAVVMLLLSTLFSYFGRKP